jgi:hypothetical protein
MKYTTTELTVDTANLRITVHDKKVTKYQLNLCLAKLWTNPLFAPYPFPMVNNEHGWTLVVSGSPNIISLGYLPYGYLEQSNHSQ